MSKYINADELNAKLEEAYDDLGGNYWNGAIDMVQEWLNDMPAADVAEVVYCKNCKHRDKDDVCTELDIYAEGSVMVGDYFFCGAGERKEQNED